MEITLEKIELVKDRTGVTYKEAKEALEMTEGNVVDAIIRLEETVNEKKGFKPGERGEELLGKIKEIVGRGNVSRILVKRDEEVMLNLPLNAGIVGAILAPWGVLAGAIASFGFNCVVEFVKEDGSSIDLTSKAGEYYEVVKEKGMDVYEELQEKAPEVYEALKEKGQDAYEVVKEKAPEVYGKGKDIFYNVKDKAAEKFAKAEEEIEIVIDDIEEQIEDVEKEIKEELNIKE
ncbi:MAG: DUF4342 domain-containing protein [Clostridia bacterium]|nr:DUF4342 domain-containing protein [Clostridia bacterium]